MLPEACKKAAQQSSLGYLFGEGERHILPSFFNLLIHLQKQVTNTKRHINGGNHPLPPFELLMHLRMQVIEFSDASQECYLGPSWQRCVLQQWHLENLGQIS